MNIGQDHSVNCILHVVCSLWVGIILLGHLSTQWIHQEDETEAIDYSNKEESSEI